MTGRCRDHYRWLGCELLVFPRTQLTRQPTYLINARGADSNAGYVTSGFWGGKPSPLTS